MPTFVLPPSFFINLAGGLGLFLLGMTLLTDGLKLAAGRTLERLLTTWTSTRWRGLLTGFMLTALVQSSSALTVAVIGFVNGHGDAVTQLVLFHTAFNVLGVLLMWPLSDPLARWLLRRFRTRDEDDATPHYLDRNVAAVPVLALQALRRELARMGQFAVGLAQQAIQLNPVDLPWQPPAAHQDQPLTRQLATVEQLQLHIGTFVSDISRRPLPPDVANQLPELLRIATHFDTLARVMYHLGLQSTHPEHAPASASPADGAQGQDAIACVIPAFADALAFFQVATPDDTAPAPHNQHHLAREARERFEATYQDAKAQLLRVGASGHSQIHTVYDWLARLSDLRRAVEQTDKAVQRLAALPDLASTPDGLVPTA